MHRFRPSRSRILFEVFCAFAVSASVVGAWMQTGATALLPAAAVAALFGLVRAFDMAGREAPVAVEPQRIDFAAEDQGDLLAYQEAGVPVAADHAQLTVDNSIEQVELADPSAPRKNGSGRAKAPRKGGGRRASAPKEASVVEIELLEEAEIAPILPEAIEAEPPMDLEEVSHPHIEALFEPEPYARMQRRAFGRKGG